MFNKLKKYRLIFIKDEGLYAKEVKLKNLVVPFSFLSLLIIFIFTLLLNSKDLKDLVTLKVISQHRNNNIELNNIILEQQNTINSLLKEIDTLYEKDENLRRLIKLPSIDEDIRKLGVGGKSKNDKYNHLEYLIPDNIDIDILDRQINFLLRSVNLEKISYTDISNEISSQKNN